MKRPAPRPICPECGSADVVVGDKTGTCNRCGELFRAGAARAYLAGVDGPMSRSSIEDRWRQLEAEDLDEQRQWSIAR